MKFTPEVVAALQTLRDNATNDFERHRIDVLERDLRQPPQIENLAGEIWRTVADFEDYMVSNFGRVLSLKKQPNKNIETPFLKLEKILSSSSPSIWQNRISTYSSARSTNFYPEPRQQTLRQSHQRQQNRQPRR